MTTATPLYGTAVTMTMTLASLASQAGLLIGRQSTIADNSVDLADDVMVGGKIVTTTGSTTNTRIEIWAFGSYDGISYTAGAGAADAAFTPDAGAKNLMKLLESIPNITTASAVTYVWGPKSIAQAFGGIMPIKWGIYVTQNTALALAASGHEVKYTPIKFQST